MEELFYELFNNAQRCLEYPISIEFNKEVKNDIGIINFCLIQKDKEVFKKTLECIMFKKLGTEITDDGMIDKFNEWKPSDRNFKMIISSCISSLFDYSADQTIKSQMNTVFENKVKDELLKREDFIKNL